MFNTWEDEPGVANVQTQEGNKPRPAATFGTHKTLAKLGKRERAGRLDSQKVRLQNEPPLYKERRN